MPGNRWPRRLAWTLIVALPLGWGAWDLTRPVGHDARIFDPAAIGRLDAAMWKSYYDRKPGRLFLQMAVLLRSEFHLPRLRSYLVAGQAARAAFVFKKGHDRVDYERALPSLTSYYRALRRAGTSDFDAAEAARLELEWWIVHRERAGHGGEPLERALAEAAAAFYRVPADVLGEYARERTVAMDIRDTRQAAGGVAADDWDAIERHLIRSWTALASAVQPTA